MITKKIKKTIIVSIFALIAYFGAKHLMVNSISSDRNTDSPYVGTWAAEVVESKGIEYDAAETIGDIAFTLYADGTGEYIGADMEGDIEWESAEDGLKLTDVSGSDYFTYEDEKLVLHSESEDESVTVYFEKRKQLAGQQEIRIVFKRQ